MTSVLMMESPTNMAARSRPLTQGKINIFS